MTETAEVQVPQGFIELHWAGMGQWVRVSDIISFYAKDERNINSYFELRGDDFNRHRSCDETPAEIAALIAEAQGGGEAERGGEATQVLAWLAVSPCGEDREVNRVSGLYHAHVMSEDYLYSGDGSSAADAIAHLESRRAASITT